MNDLRAAAQQALKALEQSETTVRYEGFGMAHREAERKHQAAITALRAALAQQAEPVQEQPEPVQEPEGLDWRYTARIGYVVKPYTTPSKAKPVQEPVAWIHTDPDKPRVKFLEWRENEPGYRGRWTKTPLYTAPPRCPNCASLEAQNDELDRKLAEMERADLSRCPQCGGIADNGHDRQLPPNPYWCTRCVANARDDWK